MGREDRTPDEKMYCSQCGGEVPDSAKYCPSCASRIEQQAAPREGNVTDWDAEDAEYAGFWQRFWARLLDSVIMGVFAGIALGGATAVLVMNTNDEPHPLALAYFYVCLAFVFVGTFGYFWMCTAQGATLGMDALGISIVRDIDGESPGWAIGLGRVFVESVVGWLLAWTIVGWLLMYLWMIWDRKHQTWYDKAVGTIVVQRE